MTVPTTNKQSDLFILLLVPLLNEDSPLVYAATRNQHCNPVCLIWTVSAVWLHAMPVKFLPCLLLLNDW